jgi:membrane protease YdiL (CAAX protease family)
MGPVPAGWYRDPWGHAWWRWWNGSDWTGYTDIPSVAALPTGPPPAPVRPGEVGLPIRAGGIAALGIVVGLALSTVTAIALALAGASLDGAPMLVASTLGLWVGLVGACVVAVRRKGTGSLRDLGLARLRWFDPLLGVGFAVAGLVAVGMVLALLSSIFPEILPGDRSDLSGPIQHGGVIGTIAVVGIAVVGAPFVEELFFRGLLQTTFVARWGPAVGIVVQALLFGLVHLSPDAGWGNVGVFVGILVVGGGLGLIRYFSGRLDPGMCTHAAYNALILTLTFLL